MIEKIRHSEEDWKKILTKEQYNVLRKKGTEKAFANAYYGLKDKGEYLCAACDLPVFSSDAKYESGTGWPSFFEPISPENVEYRDDCSFLLGCRNEVICARCESHLGHVFDDGPEPTGKRYCMNSLALKFVPQNKV